MPSKSQAQRRKFAELLVAGKISPETFAEWSHVLWLIYTYHTDAAIIRFALCGLSASMQT
jgi:hypothetical protein